MASTSIAATIHGDLELPASTNFFDVVVLDEVAQLEAEGPRCHHILYWSTPRRILVMLRSTCSRVA